MDRLKVPDALARPGIDTHEALGEQVVSRAVPAVIVIGRRRQRQIDVPELLVAGRVRPHVGGTGVLPGRLIALGIDAPGVDAELALPRNRVESPESLTRPNVVPAHVSAGRLLGGSALDGVDVLDVGADDDDVVDHQRRRVHVELGKRAEQSEPEVDLSRVTEAEVALAGPGIEGDELRSQRAEDPRLVAIGPVGAPACLTHPLVVARSGVPDHVAGRGVERRDGAEPGADEEPPLRHERSVLRADRSAGRDSVPDRVGDDRLPPDDLDVRDRVLVDLVERGVFGAGVVGGIRRPLHRLPGGGAGECQEAQGPPENRDSARNTMESRLPHVEPPLFQTSILSGHRADERNAG